MKRWTWLAICIVALLASLGAGCSRRGARTVPEEDLTPFQRLMVHWTRDYSFRRSVGGDDLVSERSAIVERPTHEERLVIEATLFADTLVNAEVARLCGDDTTGIGCDSVARRYANRHNWPRLFRVEVTMLANLATPFALEPLVIYLTDNDGVDYEPRRKVFTEPVTREQSYLDREVKRYDPYTQDEYRVYRYSQGYEYQSTGGVTLYFDRVNVIGKDLLRRPDAKLTLTFRQERTRIGSITWNLPQIREAIRRARERGQARLPDVELSAG